MIIKKLLSKCAKNKFTKMDNFQYKNLLFRLVRRVNKLLKCNSDNIYVKEYNNMIEVGIFGNKELLGYTANISFTKYKHKNGIIRFNCQNGDIFEFNDQNIINLFFNDETKGKCFIKAFNKHLDVVNEVLKKM